MPSNMAFNPLDHKIVGEFEYQGITFCCLQKGVNFNMLDGCTADPNDILIATYPKSGMSCSHFTLDGHK